MSTSQSLSRLLSSVINLSAANPALHSTRSQPLSRSVSDSLTRFLCSSTQRARSRPDNPLKEQADAPEQNLPLDDKQSEENKVGGGCGGGDDDDGHVNKQTGEVGGPKGPEPTRYGDWERNGRCYDF